MGRATIISGGTDGRYVIQMDYGMDLKTRLLAALSIALADIDTRILQAQVKVDEAQAKEDIQLAKYELEIDRFIEEHPFFAPGSPKPSDQAVIFELNNLRKLQAIHRPLRDRVVILKYQRAQTLKRITFWTSFNPLERRPAWCVDLTEDAAPGATVATAEIPGETNLMLIAPGARAPRAEDGQLMAREVMSPEQAYWNAAVLPGWQKEKPTYRWGTITALNQDADTCSIDLAPARSSARNLNVNKLTSLSNVPIVYMVCNSGPFEVGSRVVVKFEGQSWDTPKVIGFLDNPKPCNWSAIGTQGGLVHYAANVPGSISLFDRASLDVRARKNGGPWYILDYDSGVAGEIRFYHAISPTSNAPDQYDLQMVIHITPDYGSPLGRIACSSQPLTVGRNITEYVIFIAGQVAFNVANTDSGFAGSPHYNTASARSRGGIRNSAVGGYHPVDRLAYVLTGGT